MDFGTDKVDQVCPAPDPAPHPPRRFTLPAGAVDTHAHVVGHSFVPERSYTPPPASAGQYLSMLDAVGTTYGVLVQISVHGTDNTVMLDVVEGARDRLRAVAVVAPDVDDRTLAHLQDSGVVGLRLNTLSGGGIGLDQLARYDAICAEMGWHLQFLTNTRHLAAAAADLRTLTVPYVVDHMGDFDVTAGVDAPAWTLFLKLMADGAWTKLSGAFRMARTADYSDTIPFAQSLIEAAPDRCVWGSDWPHVGFWGQMPNVGALLDLLPDWAPDPVTREAILTTNAHRLYGFTCS
ncbi:amidohydrolase family protein [Rhodococcus sp. NPDC127530]|uniref:amidohydrolase family protein n=1 Tax=unclassified Rhodococcus (in: high G+C Gram-positive bacteria) TaxID=192944 RepID=UPI00362B8160